MAEIALEKRFAILCEITRAQHFAWRQAVVEMCPDADPVAVGNKMWEITGLQTGRAYLERVDRTAPLAPQIAHSIAWSSQCMGEDAVVEEGKGSGGSGKDVDEAFVRHHACPWLGWHQKRDLVAEDRPGCDAWFKSTIDTVNRELGTALRFETLEALPDGGACCLRRLWVEQAG